MAMHRLVSALLAISLLSGCAAKTPVMLAASDGFISINRVAPEVSAPATALGFLPVPAEKWIEVDTAKGTITLMEGDSVLNRIPGEGRLKATPGSYQLMHKQRSPLWYAGDSYFTRRGLEVPSAGDKDRYRRGALGDFALFIDQDTSLHSAPLWTEEVGGLRFPDEELRKIYYSVDIGTRVEIK